MGDKIPRLLSLFSSPFKVLSLSGKFIKMTSQGTFCRQFRETWFQSSYFWFWFSCKETSFGFQSEILLSLSIRDNPSINTTGLWTDNSYRPSSDMFGLDQISFVGFVWLERGLDDDWGILECYIWVNAHECMNTTVIECLRIINTHCNVWSSLRFGALTFSMSLLWISGIFKTHNCLA